LIVSWSDGTGAIETGSCFGPPLGNTERDCAHPDNASPSIPTQIFRFIIETVSILGEYRSPISFDIDDADATITGPHGRIDEVELVEQSRSTPNLETCERW
jgi:hypothetical protein